MRIETSIFIFCPTIKSDLNIIVTLTTEWQTYSFTFEMTEDDDDKGRVEFNMGAQGSTATIHIRNVRLELAE